MKPILIISILSFGLATSAFAQSENGRNLPGSNHSWKSMHLPDTILPSPCGASGSRVILASTDATALPIATPRDGVRLVDYQCAGNSRPHPTSPVPPAPRSSAK